VGMSLGIVGRESQHVEDQLEPEGAVGKVGHEPLPLPRRLDAEHLYAHRLVGVQVSLDGLVGQAVVAGGDGQAGDRRLQVSLRGQER